MYSKLGITTSSKSCIASEDGTFSIIIELDYEDDDPIYDEHEKGIYGHPIYGEINAGDSIVEAIDSLIYFKNFFIYHRHTTAQDNA